MGIGIRRIYHSLESSIRLSHRVGLHALPAYFVCSKLAVAQAEGCLVAQVAEPPIPWYIVYGISIGAVLLMLLVLVRNILLRRSILTRTSELQRELSERQKAEMFLADSRHRLAMILDNLQGVVYRCTLKPEFSMDFLSQGCLEQTGYPVEEFLSGKIKWEDLIVPEDQPHFRRTLEEVFLKQQTYEMEYRIVTRFGQVRWIWDKGSGIYDQTGKVIAQEGFVLDISHRKEVEEKLRSRERQLASIFKSSPLGMGLVSNRVFMKVNDRICEMTGYTRDELLGQNAQMLYPSQQEYEKVGDIKYHQIEQNGVGTVETRWRCKDGRIIDILLSSAPIEPDDLALGVIFNVLDITDTKSDRQIAIAERDKAQQYLDIAGVMMLVLDTEGRIKLINKRGCQILECSESQVLGKEWFDTFLPETVRKKTQKVFCDLITDQGQTVEYVENAVRTLTGQEKLIAWHNTIIRDEAGVIIGTLSSGLDITEQRRAEQALAESELRFRSIIESSPMGIHTYELMDDGRLIFTGSNEAARKILDIDDRQEYGKTIEEAYPETLHIDLPDIFRRLCREGGNHYGNNYEQYLDMDVEITRIPSKFLEFYAFQTSPGKMAVMLADVTDRVETQRQLQYTQFAVDHASDSIFRIAPDSSILYVNDAACSILGYSREELLTMRVQDIDTDRPVNTWSQHWQEVKAKKTMRFESYQKAKDRRIFPVEVTSNFIEYGNQEYIWAFVHDISSRKAAEEALAESEQRFRSVIESSPIGVSTYILEPDGRLIFTGTNEAAESILKRNLKQVVGKPIEEAFPELVGTERPDIYRRIARQGGAYHCNNFDYPEEHRGAGGYHEIHVFQTSPDKIAVMFMDVTDRIHTQRQLELTQFAVEHAGEAIFWMGPDAKFMYVNDAACRSLKYSRDELLTMSVQDIDSDFPAEIWPQHWQEVKVSKVLRFESHHKTKDGHVFPVEITSNFLEFQGSEYLWAFVRDITERKATQEALQFTQFTVDHAGEAAFWMDSAGKLIYVNDAACQSLGYTREELLQMSIPDLDPNFPKEKWDEHWAESRDTGSWRIETQHLTKDGRLIPVEVSVNYVCYEGVEYHCSFARDIRERKAAEAAQQKLLREVQAKNEELESIVFIASHDLRSPLVNIQGFTGELEKSLNQLEQLLNEEALSKSAHKQLKVLFGEDIPESVSFIKSGNRKMDVLLKGLLRLSRIGTADVQPAELNMQQLFESIVNSFRFRIRDMDISIVIDETIPDCQADAVLANQVFTNLIENAIKYRSLDRPAEIHINGRSKNGTVVYCVRDNGIGIASEHIARVFEIFHRLNPDSDQEGEGLGLTIVRRILKRLDGNIWIESEPDVGTSVFVELPGV